MILLGVPVALAAALLATLYCKIRRFDVERAKPVILLSALAGFLIGAFGPLFLTGYVYFFGPQMRP